MKKPKMLETTAFPSPIRKNAFEMSDEVKVEEIMPHVAAILEILGLDMTDSSLQKTPSRVAEMYVKEIFSGLNPKAFPKISFIDAPQASKNLVMTKVSFTSFCEHHLVPMHGKAYIAYLPNKKLIGLSKISRIVRYFAKRPQVQERLTAQIGECFSNLLETEDVGISLIAEHFCVIARGVEDEHSHTVTNYLTGKFKSDENLRKEFFEGMNRELS